MGPQELTFDRDELLETLADDACRETVSRLESRDGSTVPLDDLAGGESGSATDASPSVVALHHVVLPKLAAADVLEYDPASRTVEYESRERVQATVAAIERMNR